MEIPQPSEGHRQLNRLVGTWTGEEHIQPSPWDPTGATAVGRVRNAPALDGLAVLQEYEQERGGSVAFRGLGVFHWDAAAGEHVLYWLDTLSPHRREFRGGFKGDVLTLTSHEEHGLARATWDFGSRNRYVYRLEVSPDGMAWNPYMEARYARQK
jgi:hypothetical protein